VRELLEEGDVVRARDFLGRHYSIQGPVVHGHKTGRGIGFPTANMDTSKVQIPGTGVYAVYVTSENVMYSGVVNIGFNPTFNRDRLSVEVHIFDFGDTIYGEEIEITFIERIRGEIQFQSAEDLVAQIQKDIATAKTILSRNPL
jgi:riboflavin kinase / FMN adenylyltransferase